MPFEVQEIQKGSTTIYLMHYDDFEAEMHLDRLTNAERERYFSFKSDSRKNEFVATRILRHKIFGFEHIHYDPHGAPYIEDEGYLSISHSKKLIGIATNKEYQIALDLESPRQNIKTVAYRYISDIEKKYFDCSDDMTLTRIWSAKEALYKLAGRRSILFKEHLILKPGQNGKWIGLIDNFDHVLKIKLDIFEHEATVVSYNCEEIERQQHYDITKD